MVILGGGIAGHPLAPAFKQSPLLDVTLVDPKTYIEISMAVSRMFFNKNLFGKSHVEYSKFLSGINIAQGRAVDLTLDRVLVETMRSEQENTVLSTDYDYRVVATVSNIQKNCLSHIVAAS